MAKYRKKPVVVEAFRFFDFILAEETPEWFIASLRNHRSAGWAPEDEVWVATLEGDHRVQDGDWIIRGVKGEVYPCKPDIFEMSYEEVE